MRKVEGMNGHPLFYELLDLMAEVHHRKNGNYARKDDPLSNLRRCERIGIPAWKGIIVRLQDKWDRIENLADGVQDLVGESIGDTLLDNAVYSLLDIITLIEVGELSLEGLRGRITGKTVDRQ